MNECSLHKSHYHTYLIPEIVLQPSFACSYLYATGPMVSMEKGVTMGMLSITIVSSWK